MKNKCDCYLFDFVGFDLYDPFKLIKREYCNGTPERDECTCGGDPAKCDFYPEIREKALNKELAEKFDEFCKKTSNPTPTNATTIYYAHHQWKYGTKIEEYELDLIKKYFPHAVIFNPSTDLKTKDCGDEEIVMKECLGVIEGSDIVIFSSMDGMIGKGVCQEIHAARKSGKLLLYIYQNRLTTEFRTYPTPEHNSDRLYADVCADMCSD